ncbi:MAG TPA: hypothetical protein VFE58_17210 [Tepidisphaeraceae bacterium]|nr:hypothetical protein [Tepidisphaeraceae bacterium]
MKRYRVIVAPIVLEQIRDQMLYIAQDSINNALAWEDRLRAEMKSIGGLGSGHVIDEVASKSMGVTVHKLVFERTYLIHYVVQEKERVIEIINFRHGARLPRRGEH